MDLDLFCRHASPTRIPELNRVFEVSSSATSRGIITSLPLMAEHLQMQPKKQLSFFAERVAADGGSISETNPYCVLQRTSIASGVT